MFRVEPTYYEAAFSLEWINGFQSFMAKTISTLNIEWVDNFQTRLMGDVKAQQNNKYPQLMEGSYIQLLLFWKYLGTYWVA